MKKLITTVLISTFLLGMMGTAEAASFTFTENFLGSDTDTTYFSLSKGADHSSVYDFDLVNTGISNNYAQLGSNTPISPISDASGLGSLSSYSSISATLYYYFSDPDGTSKVNKVLVTTGASDGSQTLLSAITSSGLSFSNGKYTGSYTLTQADINSWLSDGKLAINISTSGNTSLTVDAVGLDVTSQTVPLPAAALLLGSGLIGLIGLRRKDLA